MGQAEILAATASPSAIDAAKTTGVASAIAAATRSTVYAVGTAASGAAAAAVNVSLIVGRSRRVRSVDGRDSFTNPRRICSSFCFVVFV
jgi:LDH2 family malate/lactate/ureidoglycolate dehydrogenase